MRIIPAEKRVGNVELTANKEFQYVQKHQDVVQFRTTCHR